MKLLKKETITKLYTTVGEFYKEDGAWWEVDKHEGMNFLVGEKCIKDLEEFLCPVDLQVGHLVKIIGGEETEVAYWDTTMDVFIGMEATIVDITEYGDVSLRNGAGVEGWSWDKSWLELIK